MRYLSIICLFFINLNTALANPLNSSPTNFDIKKANQQFDHINLQLSVHNLDLNNLETAVNTLTTLTNQSEDCVEEVQKKLINIQLLIKQGNGSVRTNDEGGDLVYLNSQQKELGDEEAQCRLFTIRAKEAIEAYKTAIAQLKQEEALTRGIPLWTLLSKTIENPPHTTVIPVLIGKSLSSPISLIYLMAIICASIASATIILYRIRKSQFARHHLRFRTVPISYVLLVGTLLFSGAIFTYLSLLSQDYTDAAPLLVASKILFIYLITMLSIIFLFKIKKASVLFYWYSLDIAFFRSFSMTLLNFYLAIIIARLLAHSLQASSSFWQLCQSIFILAALSNIWYLIYAFCKTNSRFKLIQHHMRFILRFSTLLLTGCATINVLGYYTLAAHLTLSGFVTVAIIFIMLLITQGIHKVYVMMEQQPSTKANIIKYFGYRTDQVFAEFLILRTVAQLITIATSIYFIGQSWGFATDYIVIFYDQILHGVHLGNATIYPTRIVSGIIVFCLLYLLFRAISTAISRHQQFEDEEETQVAVASILTYVGFSLALISGLLVAGFNFTGLAIIAGALSVGIGLGLQSIVNNFVSGLILLIEKPIRPGDRINVDGIEGFVKKVRVRSTQIITPSSEDIIIPNSDLITRPVTNYMFSDKYCRISCEIGVAYGSDTYLVRDVLLNVAHRHEEVIKTGRSKPIVLFRSFADNSLDFQLVCLIKDVNNKSVVHSDLNFAIERAFQEHHIDMPFPQREVHIKLTDVEPIAQKVMPFVPA